MLMLSSCSEPHVITIYYFGEDIDERVSFDEVIINDQNIDFHLTLHLNESKSLDEVIEISNLEYQVGNIGYGYGVSFEENLVLGIDYVLILDDNELIDINDVELIKEHTYSFTIIFDLSSNNDLSTDSIIEDVQLLLIINGTTVKLSGNTD